VPYRNADPIPASVHPRLRSEHAIILSSLFPVYDWVAEDGYEHFSEWVHTAAMAAGKK